MSDELIYKPDTDERNLHRVGEDGEPPCGASGSEWVRLSLSEAQDGAYGLCRNESCFGGDVEDPIDADVGGECVDCNASGDDVMPREVGRRTVRLCPECATERRRLTPPPVLSHSPENPGGDAATRG